MLISDWSSDVCSSDLEDAKVFVDGRVRTGDVGVLDADGYLKIVDRLKDMISVGGFKVFPSQIEAVLYGHPDVREALAIGIPDAYMGQRPKAVDTLNAGATNTGEEVGRTSCQERGGQVLWFLGVACLIKKKI